MSKVVLITGFDPFGGEKVNPSYEAVKRLPDNIDGNIIIKKEIPTEFFNSKDVMISLIHEYKPDIIINVGQAGGRKSISIEKKAFNMIKANIPDNKGNMPNNVKIKDGGKRVLSSTLPIKKIKNALKENNISSYISKSAGRYVCNYIMYEMLDYTNNTNMISGFIHVPFSKDQVKDKEGKVPYMEVTDMRDSLLIVLKEILK